MQGELSKKKAEALAEAFQVLSDPSRLRILALLREERPVNDLVRRVGPSQSAVSHQLRALRQMKLVSHRRVGKSVLYRLSSSAVQTLLEKGMEMIR